MPIWEFLGSPTRCWISKQQSKSLWCHFFFSIFLILFSFFLLSPQALNCSRPSTSPDGERYKSGKLKLLCCCEFDFDEIQKIFLNSQWWHAWINILLAYTPIGVKLKKKLWNSSTAKLANKRSFWLQRVDAERVEKNSLNQDISPRNIWAKHDKRNAQTLQSASKSDSPKAF